MLTRANGPTLARPRWSYLLVAALMLGAIMPAALLQRGNLAPSAPQLPGAKALQPTAPDLGRLPLQFEPNAGQTDPAVRFMAHIPGGLLFFTRSGFTLSLAPNSAGATAHEPGEKPASTAVTLHFLGGNPAPTIQTTEQLDGKVNYIVGNDPSSWQTNVPTYAGIIYRDVYPGIDLRYDGAGGKLKSTYTVASGAEASAIRWRYSGAQRATVDAQGNLQIVVGDGNNATTITEDAPTAWQTLGGKQVPVSVAYQVAGDGSVAFALGTYDTAQPLTIDPALTFSTFLGGSSADQGMGIASDPSGNIYVAGRTWSTNFPTQNAYQPASAGGHDVFIAKIQPSGALVYSTYLGGTGDDEGNAIAVDATGAVYVTGSAISTNFPTHNAYQPTRPANPSAFLTKLTPDGSSLAYSTYFAGTTYTDAWAVATDGSNGAYIVGRTNSANLPRRNAYQQTFGGIYDVYLARFNTAASGDASLVYSTYLGGSANEYVGTTGYGLGDWGHGVAADAAGNAYVAGQTFSTNFPVRNPYQAALNGLNDAFVTKVNTAAAGDASLVYSTYLGSTGQDAGKDVDVDAQGNAYVTGGAGHSSFPTLNPYMPCVTGSPFVTKLNPAGNALVYSTCFGAGGRGDSTDIAVDTAGSAYIVGTTSSATFPMVNPIQATLRGPSDAFVVKLVSAGNNVVYSTYLGGTSYEEGIGIAVAGTSNTYVTGDTRSSDFPVQNPIQVTCQSCPTLSDAFISTIDEASAVTPTPTTAPPTRTNTPTATNTQPSGGTATATNTRRATYTPAPTFTPPATNTATATNTPGGPTPVPCAITFTDVQPSDYFYEAVRYLYCAGAISGYGDNTFRPYNNTTRGQLVKIVVLAENWPLYIPAQPSFTDVPPSDPFYAYIETAVQHQMISGYTDGTFRPYNNVTRGQLCKIIAVAERWALIDPIDPHFTDVNVDNPFYVFVETAYSHGVISGYGDGTFRWANNATRGQLSKIVHSAVTQP